MITSGKGMHSLPIFKNSFSSPTSQDICTNIEIKDKSLFHDVNINLFLPLGRVKHQEPKLIWQKQAGEGQSPQ